MRKIFLLALLSALSFCLCAQPAHGDYRTRANGSWHGGATWERFDQSTMPGSWVAASAPSASTAGVTTITHEVTVSTTATIDQAVIASGGKLIISGSAFTTSDGSGDDLTIASGGSLDWNFGNITINGSLGTIVNQGTVTVNATTAQLTQNGSGSFHNNNMFTKTGPGKLQMSSTNFSNNSGGTFHLQQGEIATFATPLNFHSGSFFTGSATATLSPGAAATFNLAVSSPVPFVFPTQLNQTGGSMTINTPAAVHFPNAWTQSSGAGIVVTTSTSAQNITVTPAFVMNGSMNGPGDLTTVSHFTNNNPFNGGALNVGGNITINGNITATNGALLTVGGMVHEWQGGTLSRNLTVDAGESLLFTTTSIKTLAAGNEVNTAGMTSWTSGTINNAGTINNSGSFTANATTIQLVLQGSGSFNNNSPGSFSKQGSGKLQLSSTNFLSFSGSTLDLQQGELATFATTFDLKSGSSFTGNNTAILAPGSGTFTLSVGSPSPFVFPTQLNQTGGTFNINTPSAVQFPNPWTQSSGAGIVVNTTSSLQDVFVTPAFVMNGTFNGPGDLTALSDFTNNNTFNGDALTVGGNIIINGSITATNGTFLSVGGSNHEWQSGTLSRNLTVDAGETLLLTTTSAKTLSAGNTLSHSGTASWTGGQINNNGIINNNGSFTASATTSQITLSGSGTFNNNGTFTKQGAAKLQLSSTSFLNNSGSTLDLQQGDMDTFATTLDLKAGSTFTGNSSAVLRTGSGIFTLSVASPTPFVFPIQFTQTGGTLNINTPGAVSFPNAWTQSSGGGVVVNTVTASQDVSVTQDFIMNGTFNGPGDLSTASDYTSNNTFNGAALSVGGDIVINGNITATNSTQLTVLGSSAEWQSGTLSRPFTVDAGDLLTFTGSGTKTVDALLTVADGGTADWQSGPLNINASDQIINNGVFSFSSAGNLSLGGSGTFSNNKTFTKSGSGTLYINIDFTNGLFGLMQGSGAITAFAARVFTNNGTLAPGAPASNPEVLVFNGDEPLSDNSSLEMTINGTTAGSGHDQLQRTGNMVLDGDLLIKEGSVTPNHPYRLIAVTNGTITGAFDLIDGDLYSYTASVVTEGTNSFFEVTAVTPLPVRMIDFTGTIAGTSVLLQWKTAAELNTQRFELQRAEGVSAKFVTIGSIDAAGNSVLQQDYAFTDRQPFADVNFYRLKIIDQDGNFEYSRKVVVRMKAQQGHITLYPNPVRNGGLQVQIGGNTALRLQLQVRDMTGRLMQQKTVGSGGGSLFTYLDVSMLPEGIYMLTVNTGKDLFTRQFIKQ